MWRDGDRTLVLHADDLGMNPAVNAGIECAFAHGLLTSASILANGPACTEALRSWKRLQEAQCSGSLWSTSARLKLGDGLRPFDLGLHVNLTQGRPLTPGFPAELLDASGQFPGVFRLFQRLVADWTPASGRESGRSCMSSSSASATTASSSRTSTAISTSRCCRWSPKCSRD